jgi:hypothetical protein
MQLKNQKHLMSSVAPVRGPIHVRNISVPAGNDFMGLSGASDQNSMPTITNRQALGMGAPIFKKHADDAGPTNATGVVAGGTNGRHKF